MSRGHTSLFKHFLFCSLLAVLTIAPVYAQPLDSLGPDIKPKGISSLDEFKKLAVLDQGRIKPVDTYARTLLLKFSGKSSFNRRPATEWLAKLLFAPMTVVDDKVFLINNPDIATALSIEPESHRRYSFSQLDPHIQKLEELARMAYGIDEKERSVVETEILRVYDNVLAFVKHAQVFAFALPSSEFDISDNTIVQELGLPRQSMYSYYELVDKSALLRKKVAGFDRTQQAKWSDKEREYVNLVKAMFNWSMNYRDLPFKIVPTHMTEKDSWLSPQDVINSEFQAKEARDEVAFLREMVVDYWNGDQLAFNLATRSFENAAATRLHGKQKASFAKIPLELFYDKADLFLWAKLFYGLAFFLFLFSFFSSRAFLRTLTFFLIVAGLVPHAVALVLRIIIMARPPVSNLFETFIFVGFIVVVAGLIIERVNKRWVGNVVASVGGLVFLLIAAKYAAEGDTMQMLVAVLNSNFWLATHVLSITIGYSGVCVAGLVGHLYILQAIRNPSDKDMLESTYQNLLGALGFGLMMSFLGTMLGGIWADQSWGRFWGWDPKENGALLIVLWCTIVFHSKVGRYIGPLGVAVGSVLGIIVVMWAWFGVNLLSVGLHSYGFTSGVATGLFIYVFAEVLFLSICGPLAQAKLAGTKHPRRKSA